MFKNKKIILAIITLAIGLAFLLYSTRPNTAPINTGEINKTETDTEKGKNDAPEEASLSQQTQTPTKLNEIEAPVLIKSSGNNGPVPPGANIEFVCQSKIGYICTITLTNSASGQVIDLGQKKVNSNPAGITGSYWYWSAIQGSWTVVAEASTSSAQKATSKPQNLEVR